MRPICPNCERNPCAINCYHNEKVYYRKMCNACLRKNKKLTRKKPRWELKGYKKKPTCERCGFQARHTAQLTVFHVDGKLNNNDTTNLKTVCLNCVVEIKRSDLPWRRGEIEPDL